MLVKSFNIFIGLILSISLIFEENNHLMLLFFRLGQIGSRSTIMTGAHQGLDPARLFFKIGNKYVKRGLFCPPTI